MFWLGATSTNWNANNWGSAAAGPVVAGLRPNSGDSLFFDAANLGAAPVANFFNPNNDFAAGALTNLTISVTDNDAAAGHDFSFSGNGLSVGAGGLGVAGTDATGTELVSFVIGGSGGLTKSGSVGLTVSSDNTYSGATLINAGTLTAANDFALGTGAVTVAGGATLQVPAGSTAPGLVGQYYNITPANSGNQNPNFSSQAALTAHLSGQTPAVTAVAPPTLTSASTFDFANDGSGFPSPYTAGASNFEVTWTGFFNAPNSGTYTFDTGSDDGSMIFIDGQTVVNNNFFQGVTVRSGSVNLTAGQHTIEIAFYQGGGGYGMFADVSGPSLPNQRLPLSLLSHSIGSSVNLTLGSLSGAGNVELGATASLTVGTDNTSKTFSGVISGSGSVTKVGTGTETLSGANVYGGATNVQNGTLQLAGGANRLPGATTLTLGTGSTGGILDLNGQSQQLTDLLTGGTGTNLVVNSGAGIPNLTLTPSDADVFAGQLGSGGQSAFSLVVNGTGSLTLSGANAYTGTTTVVAGTLIAGTDSANGAAGAFGSGTSDILVGATSGSASASLLTGGTVTIGRNVTVQSGNSGVMTLGGATANVSTFAGTVTLQQGVILSAVAGGQVNLTGTLTGASPVTVAGNGTVQLSGTNSYTGATTVNSGALNLNSALSSTSGVTVNGGKVNANVAGAVGAITVKVPFGGTFNANAANALIGTTVNVPGGTLNIGSQGAGGLAVHGSATQSAAAVNDSAAGVVNVLADGNLGTGTLSFTGGSTFNVNPGSGNTVTYGGSTVSVNNATVTVLSGTADFGSATIAVTPFGAATTSNALFGTEYNRTGLGIFNDGAPALSQTPDATANLTGALNFGSDAAFNAFYGSTLPDAFTTFYSGTFTPAVTGTYTFLLRGVDDNAILWIDTNQNGIFEAANGENLATRGCCGDGSPVTVNLVAGQQYKVAFGLEDTGGGSGLGVQFMEPAGGTITSLTFVQPDDPAQAGMWSFSGLSGGGTINVAAGATLKASAITGSPAVNLGTSAVAIQESFYVGAPSSSYLNPIDSGNGLLTQTPAVVKSLNGPLTFDLSDGNSGAQLNAESGGVTGTANFSALWQTRINITAAGAYSFGTASDDGSVVYIDLNNDGMFDPTTELIVNNNFFQGTTARTGTAIFPSAGQYSMLIGYYQGAGGAAMEARYAPGAGVSYASQTIIDPTNPAQAGVWSFSGGPAVLQLDSSTATTSDLGAVTTVSSVTGPTSAYINLGPNNTVTATSLTVAASGSLTFAGVGGTSGTFAASGQSYGTGSTTTVNQGLVQFNGPGSGTGAINVNGGILQLGAANATSSSSAVTINSTGRLNVAVANAQLANVVVNAGGFLRLSSPQDTTAGATLPASVTAGTLEINNVAIGPNFDGLQLGNGSTVTSLVAGATYASDLTLAGSTINFDTSGTGGSFTVSGVISDGGSAFGIAKLGANTLTLSGTNTYTGGTSVNAGTLLVDGSVTSAVSVSNNATLGGQGTVASITTATGSTINPGDVPGAVGTLKTSGPAGSTLAGTSLIIDLNGATADQLKNTGASTVNLSGATLNVNLIAQGSLGQTYVIVQSTGGISNTFTNFADNSDFVLGSHVYRVNYSATAVTLTDEGTVSGLSYQQQPTNTVSNVAIAPAVTVAVIDQAGNVVTSDQSGSISIAIGTNPGGGTLAGTTSGNVVNGVVTFSSLSIDKSGTGYTLVASSGGFSSITSQNFNVFPGAATHFIVSAPTSATTGVGFSFTVTALDAADNVATSYAGTVSFSSTDSAATLPAAATLSTGNGTFPATLITQGNQTITATDSGNSSLTGTSGPIVVTGTMAPPLTLGSSNLPPATLGTPYSQPLATGGTPPYTVAVVAGSLPPGFNVDSSAVLSGTATQAGTFTFTVQITDSSGAAAAGTFTLKVGPPSSTTSIIVVGADAGALSQVSVYDAQSLQPLASFYAFPAAFHGGVRVAVGDVNGDGVPDIIAGAGPGGGPQVEVFDGKTFQLIRSFYGIQPSSFTGGIYVASGDVNGDGFADIIVGADAGGGPQVTVWDGQTGAMLGSFNAFNAGFGGGVRVAAGDVNGDGRADIVTGAGPGGGPQVTVFDFATGRTLNSFFAVRSDFTGGVFVGTGDVNADGRADIITGVGGGLPLADVLTPHSGPTDGPRVSVFDGSTGNLTQTFFAYEQSFTGGVHVASSHLNGKATLLTGPGRGRGSEVKAFDPASMSLLDDFFAYDPTFRGGAFVAGT